MLFGLNKNGHLNSEQQKFVYYWTQGLSNKTIMALTGRSSNTI